MTTKQKNGIKVSFILAIAAALFIGGCEYGMNRFVSINRSIDTSISKSRIDTVYIPATAKVIQGDTVYVKGDSIPSKPVEPVIIIKRLPAETPDWAVWMLNDYDSVRIYEDTFQHKNGFVKLHETVNRNKITGRDLSFMWIDTTITSSKVVQQKRRFVVSTTFMAGLSWKNKSFTGALGLQVVTPKDKTYELQYQRITGIKGELINLKAGLPIRLIKRK